ncbi:MAG TPA: hypothetical protein VK386_09530, partial [Acidimicrobiales bacterium]|nr:hypothetical protein [Acidimicrobiales bacterium]
PSGVTTTAPAGSVSTTLPTSGASATTLPQVAIVLVPRYPAGTGGTTGSWTSPSFTVASSPWNIGWAYACTGSNPSFTVTVNPGNTAAVTGTSLTGQNVTPESTTGTFTITATGSAGCQWAVKVTGIGTPAS